MLVVEPEQLDLELFQRRSRTAARTLWEAWFSGGGHALADVEAPFATAEGCGWRS